MNRMECGRERADTGEESTNTSQISPTRALTTNIDELRDNLQIIVDVDHGLLDELRSWKILTPAQTGKIKYKKIYSQKVNQLVSDVISLSHQQQELFLGALAQTNQNHVVNYIRGNGVRKDGHGDDWPMCSTEMYDALEKNRKTLIDLIDTRLGLLEKLKSIGCINKRQKETVEVGQTSAIKNESLLTVVGRKSVADYKRFIHCLVLTKQHRVASILAPDIVGEIPPISQSRRLRLEVNHDVLMGIIDSTNGLTTEMYASDCITRRQKEFIELAASPSESSTRLLDIVEQGGQKDLNKFIECLDKTAQHHVSRILLEDGIVVPIDVKTSGGEHFQQNETLIVDLFKLVSVENKPEAVKIVRQLLKNNDVDLLTMNTKHSIRLFLFCKSYCGLQHLHEQYHSSRHLSDDVMTFFRSLLIDNDHSPDIDLHIDRLVWDTSNYTNGVTYFHRVNNLQVFSRIHQLAIQSRDTTTRDKSTSIIFDLLPLNVFQKIMMRAFVQLFRANNKITRHAQVYTMATLSAVSRKWWETYRMAAKLLLQFTSRISPRQEITQINSIIDIGGITINVEENHEVRGMAELHDRLYVMYSKVNTIKVFTSRPPFRQLDSINVQGLCDCSDIVVCSTTGQLFLADLQRCDIWRVSLTYKKRDDYFHTFDQVKSSADNNEERHVVVGLRRGRQSVEPSLSPSLPASKSRHRIRSQYFHCQSSQRLQGRHTTRA